MLPKNDFEKIMGYIQAIQRRYHFAYSAFCIFDTMVRSEDAAVVGEDKAKQNKDVIKRFKEFFLISKESLRVYFFLELAKMFEDSDQALHINKIIKFAERKWRELKAEDFAEYNKDREFTNELVQTYRGISYKDLQDVRSMLEPLNPVIERLLTYRDKWLAHDDVKKPEVPKISREEIESLFEVLAKITNMLASQLNRESWIWDNVKDDAVRHTEMVLDYIVRFEPYRRKEIQDHLNSF